jgi:hypothetical protein
MRMEMPDRWSDVEDAPAAPLLVPQKIARPALSQAYLRRHAAARAQNTNWPTGEFAGAECLYLIVTAAIAEEGDSREVFKPGDVGDVDGDTMPEFVDAWGQPIKFLRWPAGFQLSELQIVGRISNVSGGGGGGMPVTGSGTGLSRNAGAYNGGCIIVLNDNQAASPFGLDTNKTAHIVDYTCDPMQQPPVGTFQVPMGTPSLSGPSAVILAPDPFDRLGLEANSATNRAPSFATYPLIYSAGPNKCFGICTDFSGTSPLQYAKSGAGEPNLSPFYIDTENVTPTAYTGLIGGARNDDQEPNYVVNGWLDNIHNHLQGQR